MDSSELFQTSQQLQKVYSSSTPPPSMEKLSTSSFEDSYSILPNASMSSNSSPSSESDQLNPAYPDSISSVPTERDWGGLPPSVPGVVAPTANKGKIQKSKAKLQDTQGDQGDMKDRRQKRLERNRESARLSRRRRKQYLDVLEERVASHGAELDKGRREHAAKAIATIQSKRLNFLGDDNPVKAINLLDRELSRTSQEFMVLNTFLTQQLKSFATPHSHQYILWLTLQNDAFFRGGRAPSERLSAARIGERVSKN